MDCLGKGGGGGIDLNLKPIEDVPFSPELTVRRFCKTGVNLPENVIFKKLQ